MNCRVLIASFICAACLTPVAAEARDSTLVLDNNNNNIISGTITRIDGDSVFVDYSGREIEIDMDGIDIEDGSINDFFAPGMTISAKGSFDDDGHTPVLDAREVVRADGATDSMTGAILLEDND
jgi:hypothetical protein